MNIKNLSELIKNYKGYTFTIIPFVSSSSNIYGTIECPINKWNYLNKILSGFKYSIDNTKIYVYRELEYDMQQVIHKKINYADLHDNNLIIISDEKNIDIDAFPILNKYHNEYDKTTKTYKFGIVKLNLVTTNNKTNFVEISFFNNGSDKLIDDLVYVMTKIINT